jgi:cation diffusion facilitator family transporter
MGLEFAGGIISGSLAVLTDAAHMFSDVAGFMISFFSIYISKNKSTFDYSMGYHRAEILGAFVSIFLIWGLLGWLNMEATRRLRFPPEEPINADIMLITACIGFACNITNFCALNANCGKPEEEEEQGELYKSNMSYKSLSNSLMAIYQPSQAHKCIRNEKTLDENDEDIESCHGEGECKHQTPENSPPHSRVQHTSPKEAISTEGQGSVKK